MKLTFRTVQADDRLMEKSSRLTGVELTRFLHHHKEAFADFFLLQSWFSQLRRKNNWVGNTTDFVVFQSYHQLARKSRRLGEPVRHHQLMALDEKGRAVGYIRFLHLTKDSSRLRDDCTRIEEMILDPALLNTDLSRRLHDEAVRAAREYGSARVYTEFAVGLAAEKRARLSRAINSLSRKESRTPQEDEKLAAAREKFSTDWMANTMNFVKDIGFAPLGFVLPGEAKQTCSPYVRISKILNGHARPLPAFRRDGYDSIPYSKSSERKVKARIRPVL